MSKIDNRPLFETHEGCIKTRVSTVCLRQDGVLHIDIKANEMFDIKDFEDLMKAAHKMGNGKKFKNLITVGEFTIPDIEAIKFSCSKEGSLYKLADAFVISSFPQKLVGNFYLKVIKSSTPTRFFLHVEEAEKWLRELP